MAKSDIYNRAFWNAVRGEKFCSGLEEGWVGPDSYVMPDDFLDGFAAALEKDNLFRRHGTVMRTALPTDRIEAVASTGEADWVGEGVAFTESSDRFTEIKLNPCKLTSLTRVKETFIKDTQFDIEKYLRDEFARRFGRAEEMAFIKGDGITRPCGILHETQGAQIGTVAASKTALTFDDVKKLYFSLKPEHRRHAVWIMNDTTAFKLRSLKDAGGMDLWNHSTDSIFGRPVEISEHMPGTEAGARPVAFADLRYYWIVERRSLAIKMLWELYSMQGQVGIASHEILDGRLIMPEAAQVLQMAQ